MTFKDARDLRAVRSLLKTEAAWKRRRPALPSLPVRPTGRLGQATLWVFAANAAARGLYARLGWQPDGGERTEPQYGQPEVRLRRTVRA